MVDIHSHALFNVDDGSKSLEESIIMIKEAKESGFETICLTPHYLESYYENNKFENDKMLGKLKEELVRQDIHMELVLGNEVYINTNILELLEFEKITKIGNSNYMLIELPMNQELRYVKDIINELVNKGIRVIIAHPERYKYVQKDISYLEQFLDMGVVFQSNYASILGHYGDEAKKTIKKLLKGKMIQIMATDAHRCNSIYKKIDEIQKRLKKEIDKEYFNLITQDNPKKVLRNEDVVILEYCSKTKFKLFG